MKIRFIVSFLIVGLITFWKCEDNQDKDCAGVEWARCQTGIVDHRSSIAAFRSVIKEFSEGV